jgi:hypothetical protein
MLTEAQVNNFRSRRQIPTQGEIKMLCEDWYALTAANTRLERERDYEQNYVRKMVEFHPRATKLIRKGKPFLVIAIDEPYFKTAYDLIREHEKIKGTWTNEDEMGYLELLSEHIDEKE